MLQPQERRIKFSLRLTYMSRMMYLTAVTLTTFFYEMDNWKLSQTFRAQKSIQCLSWMEKSRLKLRKFVRRKWSVG